MTERVAAFFLWATVAACLAFWGLRVLVTPRAVPVQTQPVSSATVLRGDVARLFAAPLVATAGPGGATEPALASRFRLVGVMAPKSPERGAEQGIALIAVDGKPPRPYRVGARLDTALVVQSVATRSVAIGPSQGAMVVRLELPPPQAANVGSLPPPPLNADPGTLSRSGAFQPRPPPVMAPAPHDAGDANPTMQGAPPVGDDPAAPEPGGVNPGNRR